MKSNSIVWFGVGLAIGYAIFGWPTTRATWRMPDEQPRQLVPILPFYWPM